MTERQFRLAHALERLHYWLTTEEDRDEGVQAVIEMYLNMVRELEGNRIVWQKEGF